MNQIKAVQIFALLAMGIALLISYYPPMQNSAAIFALVGAFLGSCKDELFRELKTLVQDKSNVSPANLPSVPDNQA